MEFSVKSGSPEKQRSACIVVGVFEPRRLSPIAEQLDKISDGYISALLRRGELEGKPGQTLLLHHVPNVLSERILLIGCGKERELDERQYKQVIQKTINTLNDTGSMEAVCFLTELHVKGRNNYWKVRQAVETAKETLYSFDQLKTNKSEPRRPLRKMVFNVPTRRELTSGERAIQHGLAIAAGIKAAKDLGNMPPNICNAAYLASQARQLADSYSKNVITRVIGEQQMKELGMHSYLAVGQGSQNESLMSVIEYKGNASEDARPIVLVGKGLTFDSGGISIKPSEGMDEMKYDMCGAAAVYGVMALMMAQMYFGSWGELSRTYYYDPYIQALDYAHTIDCDAYYIYPDPQGIDAGATLGEILTMYTHQIDAHYYQGISNVQDGVELRPYKERYHYENVTAETIAANEASGERVVYIVDSGQRELFDPEKYEITSFYDRFHVVKDKSQKRLSLELYRKCDKIMA